MTEADEEKEAEIGVDLEKEAREDDEEEEYNLGRQGLYKPLTGSRNVFNIHPYIGAECGILCLISDLVSHLSFLKRLETSLLVFSPLLLLSTPVSLLVSLPSSSLSSPALSDFTGHPFPRPVSSNGFQCEDVPKTRRAIYNRMF
jgi:hypothetical protein